MKALWNKFTAAIGRVHRRTVVLTVVASLIFVLPTALAIGWAIRKDTPTQKITFSVEVFDKNQKLIANETASDDPTNGSNLADVLYRAITEGTAIQHPPFAPEDGTPIYISVHYNGEQSRYTCFFSLSGDDSYYIDSQGHFFLIPSSAVTDFLALPEAESLYHFADPPPLSTNQGNVITPSTASWYYKLRNETFQQAKNCVTTTEVHSYAFTGALELHFANEPNTSFVRVINASNGRLLFEGSHHELAKLTVQPETPLKIDLIAEWDEQDTAVCHGKLSYSFLAVLQDLATFSISKDSLSQGDFLILTCENIQSLDQLRISSDSKLTKYLFQSEKTVSCVILYPSEAEENSFRFTATYGAVTQSFTVSLQDAASSSTIILENETEALLQAMDPSAQHQIDNLLQNLPKPLSSTVYFQGNAILPSSLGFTLGYSFGDWISTLDSSHTVSAMGTEYLASNGAAIPALMSGEVIATGYCEALGNYVILNHGLGIQTWYAHLSDFDVRVGDIVAAGESVGKAGNGGVSTGNGVLVICTVNGNLCNPESLKKQ